MNTNYEYLNENFQSNPQYYGNYDKNVKAIRGGGVITPSNPPNRNSTTDTIKNTWNYALTPNPPVPPMFKSVYYSEPNLTTGYLSSNNYVSGNNDDDKFIGNYYYPSQQIDNVVISNNSDEQDILNDSNLLIKVFLSYFVLKDKITKSTFNIIRNFLFY